MNSKILKEYKEKYDKMKKDLEEEPKEKTVLAEEKSIVEIFEKYTDRPDESIEKSLFEYGILRNPATEKTIIGVEKSGDKFTEFIFDYISDDEIIDEINRMDNSFFDKLQGVVGSKEELLQAITMNEGNIAVIILILMGHRDNKIFDMIENSRENSIDITMLKDMVENEVEGEKQEMYEYKYNRDGVIIEVKKAKKDIEVFPEAKKININVLDEMNGYKVIYKDEKDNCRLFGKFDNERFAEKKIQQVFENIKSRKHDGGAGLYIYSPYDFKGKLVKQITESNYISLKEEIDRYDDDDELLDKMENYLLREYSGTVIEDIIKYDFIPAFKDYFIFKSTKDGWDEKIYDNDKIDVRMELSQAFYDSVSTVDGLYSNFEEDKVDELLRDFIFAVQEYYKYTKQYDEIKRELDRKLDIGVNKNLKEEDLNEGCWLVAEAREGSDTLLELYKLLGKDRNSISPLLETTEDFEKALNYLKQWEYGDEEKEYEPYNEVVKYFSNYEEIDGYIIGETSMGDVLLFAKGEWTIDEDKNLKEAMIYNRFFIKTKIGKYTVERVEDRDLFNIIPPIDAPDGMGVGQTAIVYDDGGVAYDHPYNLPEDFKKQMRDLGKRLLKK